MKKYLPLAFVLIFTAIFIFPAFSSAETFLINIKGEPRTPDGKIDPIGGAGLATDKGIIESNTTIDYENGSFEIKNAVLDTEKDFNYIAPFIRGSCFYHSYRIIRKNNRFEVSDAEKSDQDILIATQNPNINLGILAESKSNEILVDSDVPVQFLAEDLSGNWIAENGGYKKITGMANSFSPNATYKLTLTTKNNKQIIKEVSTGNYCEGTRMIKRGNYYLVEKFPNNNFPKIGFWKNAWMSILGFRLIAVIPLIAFLLITIFSSFWIIRQKNK